VINLSYLQLNLTKIKFLINFASKSDLARASYLRLLTKLIELLRVTSFQKEHDQKEVKVWKV